MVMHIPANTVTIQVKDIHGNIIQTSAKVFVKDPNGGCNATAVKKMRVEIKPLAIIKSGNSEN
jgi:hypothetical protein